MKKSAITLMTLAALVPASAFGAATEWIDIVPGARLRALSAGAEIEGKALIGLELALLPGFKTYWRIPGETGLPTEIDVSGASGPLQTELFWPVPERVSMGGYIDFVYSGHLVLPALVEASLGDALKLDVRMGICSDICVPVDVHFALPGDDSPDMANSLRLRQAFNRTPILWQDGDAPLFDIRIDAETGAVTLGYDPSRIDPMRVFPSFDGTSEVFAAPILDTDADTLVFSLLTRKDDTVWRGKPLRLTFETSNGPYEIVASPQTR